MILSQNGNHSIKAPVAQIDLNYIDNCFYTAKDLAGVKGVTPKTIYKRIANGQLKPFYCFGVTLISKCDYGLMDF